jgi:hypothetical protein
MDRLLRKYNMDRTMKLLELPMVKNSEFIIRGGFENGKEYLLERDGNRVCFDIAGICFFSGRHDRQGGH